MKLSSEELIDKFHAEIKQDYPDMDRTSLKEVVHAPWEFTKESMRSGDLSEIRLKYFGSFQVFKNRAVNMLRNLKERYQFNKIKPEEYFKYKIMIEKYLDEEKNK